MKILAIGIFGALLAALCVSCANTAEIGLSKNEVRAAAFYCDHSPWCNLVAAEKAWPIATDRQETIPVTNGAFLLQLPRNIDRLHIAGTPPTVIASYADYRISASLETVHNFGLLALENEASPTPSDGKYRPPDYFEIMFTKTLADPEPEHRFDRKLWRAVFVRKSSSKYSLITDAEIYRRGPWTIYMANMGGIAHERETIFIHRDQPDAYLRVYDIHAPKSIILDLIATVALDR